MQVETFEQTEVVGGVLESERSEEALALIEKLGLEGQSKLVSGGDVKTRCPYREMNTKEIEVYSTLFPQRVEIDKYESSMIPLRVLQVAAHAKSLEIYSKILVWSETTKPTDPLLVGMVGQDSWNAKYHILARWGEALESFDVLYEKAKRVTMEAFRAQCEDKIAQAQIILASLESQAIKKLNGNFVNLP